MGSPAAGSILGRGLQGRPLAQSTTQVGHCLRQRGVLLSCGAARLYWAPAKRKFLDQESGSDGNIRSPSEGVIQCYFVARPGTPCQQRGPTHRFTDTPRGPDLSSVPASRCSWRQPCCTCRRRQQQQQTAVGE